MLCREVAPKNDPSVETYIKRRKIEPRGRESERKSRRVVGYYEGVEEIPETIFQSLRSLILKGVAVVKKE